MEWILGGGFFASIASFLYPAVRFLNPPEAPEAPVNETSAGKKSDLKPNSAKIVKFGTKPVLLMRLGESEWKAYSAVCTHLGCIPLGQKPGDDRGSYGGWFCPCHGSVYDTSGRIRQGPAPTNLTVPPYEFTSDTAMKIG